MKTFFTLLLVGISFVTATGQNKETITANPDTAKKIQVVEAACGECKLGLHGSDCNLAVRIDGKSYFVDGTNIDSHGNAHASNGFCNAIRKAAVQGEVIDGRFKASYFKLIDEQTGEAKKKNN